mmetsp:Transcript_49865/g.125026  ORF Transcript_49865/g.125026 Transcript_49865/m.125026 type:complete len:86 (+) Transcript_49865:737-994(+)
MDACDVYLGFHRGLPCLPACLCASVPVCIERGFVCLSIYVMSATVDRHPAESRCNAMRVGKLFISVLVCMSIDRQIDSLFGVLHE